jgi:cation transport ATPase
MPRMVTHLILEVVLGIAALIAGSSLWQVFKRDSFLKRTIHDIAFLSRLITHDTLSNPNLTIEPYLVKLPSGYVVNVLFVIKTDTAAIRRIKIILGFVVLVVLTGSYLLGISYFLINTIILFLSAAARLSQQARKSAEQQILKLATILDRWHSENAIDCEEWIKQAWSLRPLYDAVVSARVTA